jgi:hypothetical protein
MALLALIAHGQLIEQKEKNMSTLSASLASFWAKESYTINNELEYSIFVGSTSQFSKESGNPLRLKAVVGSRLINVQDHFAICVEGAGDWENHLFLIFRGSTNRNYYADWFANARIGQSISSEGTFVHTGFNHIFSSMKEKLANFISSSPGSHTIHCIGHSLGGAVANLCAEWIGGKFNKSVKLYTFGTPRIGYGPQFAQKLETSLLKENIYRVYHSNDPVPMVPVFPFAHAPYSNSGYYIANGGFTIQFSAHKMKKYSDSIGAKGWGILYQPAPSLSATSIKSWLQSNHDENPNSISFWNKLNYAFSILIQSLLSIPTMMVSAGVTVVDYLAILLLKGIKLAGEAANWVTWIIHKMMRAIGMKIAETIEEVTEQLIRSVLNRLLKRLSDEVQRALDNLK